MAPRLFALTIDAREPQLLARFWAALLGRELVDGATVLPADETGFRLQFQQRDEPKTGLNLMHIELTSRSLEDQQAIVARALELGGRHYDVGQLGDEGHVVLADPEGNEFDVIEPGNNFLAGCGFLGALSCEGSQQLGYFWSRVLQWPLVWDQDEETAIQHPLGGTKIAWGGPPLSERAGVNRMRYCVAGVGDPVALGATDLGGGLFLDVDGNQFTMLDSPPA